MNDFTSRVFEAIERHRDMLLDAERYIWRHPELGFREYKTQEYLLEQYKKLGYKPVLAGDIPGFYVDILTGRPGPCVGVFGELDAVCVPAHAECDKTTGAVHACGHHAQSVRLLGTAAAFTDKEVLEDMCGSIRLFAVPAEEIVDSAVIRELQEKGVLHAMQGKQEFMYRGYLDGVDMAIMLHGGPNGFSNNTGCNGSLSKKCTFKGKAVHAASPFGGRNALYAATNALAAVNSLRETFSIKNMIRFNAIITKGGTISNQIADDVTVEGMVRALTVEALVSVNEKINRAFAAAAAAMGCTVTIQDSLGCFPRKEDRNLQDVLHETAHLVYSPELIHRDYPPSAGITDMGDVSMVMPVCHAHIGGSEGGGHTYEYRMTNREMACIDGSKIQAGAVYRLLRGDGERAKKVLAEAEVPFPSVKEYFAAREKYAFFGEAVAYNADGTVTLRYHN